MKAQKPEFVPAKSRFLRRRRIVKAANDVERGLKDTERRGVPNDVPGNGSRRRRV
ncbi:MAG TPA: hypothetical protein VL199_05855 [Burkholderiales bacterium]|jgi:hypothetical protein|nr:hypothetical protein [Burkholderiales bacterium]